MLAGRQHGVVSHRQLLRLGLGRGAITHRSAAGRLHPVHIGVYAVGHPKLTERGRWLAAVLACGPGAVLSHRSAAALWGLRATSRPAPEVSAPRTHSHCRGVHVHLPRRLHTEDRRVRDAIPITSVARTLLDLAEVVPLAQLERAFEEAERTRLLDMSSLQALTSRSNGRRGLRQLMPLLASHRDPAPLTRSELERKFLALCETAGIPRPAVNARLAGLEVDMVWQEPQLVVELDGFAFHRTRAAFERDRSRDATLQLEGYRVLRITARRLDTDPEGVARTVRSLLGSDVEPFRTVATASRRSARAPHI